MGGGLEVGAEEDDVLCWIEGRAGRVVLNRPRALHALTADMVRRMTDALVSWREDPRVQLVIFSHAGERGFCAGGDIRMLAQSGAGDGQQAREFFFEEYRLNHLIFDYPKPTLAIMDGLTMGGGAGLVLPCRYRVATERTVFAMPETGIGLFPDVGAGWHLSRMPDHAGYWLALTGARIGMADCEHFDAATDCIGSDLIPMLVQMLTRKPTSVAATLAVLRAEPGVAEAAERAEEIRDLFGRDSVEAIVAGLQAAATPWAAAQLAAIKTKSPQALKVAFRQLRLGAAMPNFETNMVMEYRIAARIVQRHDFLEGVRAVIVDKDNAPSWSPATLEEVADPLLDEIFAPLAPNEEWSPLPEAVTCRSPADHAGPMTPPLGANP